MGESAREGRYLTMENPGNVMLNDDVIGSFTIDDNDRVVIQFNKGAAGVEETLEFATEQGLVLGLAIKPVFEES